jgi:hypothetical protein
MTEQVIRELVEEEGLTAASKSFDPREIMEA